MNFEKPRYRWSTQEGMYKIMSTEIAKHEDGGVPDWMRRKSTGATSATSTPRT